MGYFNYFIKCIIRNIAYRLCKPKVLLTVLLAVAILFVLHSTGYCALDDLDYEMIADGFATITDNQGVVISQLSSMGVDVDSMQKDLTEINNLISGINSTTSNISDKVSVVISRLENLNSNLVVMAQQQNIYYENVTNELEEIKNILIGVSTDIGNLTLSANEYAVSTPSLSATGNYEISSGAHFGYGSFNYTFESGYTYDFVCNSSNTSQTSKIYYTFDTVSAGNNIYAYYVGLFTPNSAHFSVTPHKDTTVTILLNNPAAFHMTVWSITKKPSGSLSGLNNTIEQGNQLQQEQNQLQQEQNDLIKDDNVNTDNLQFATDDTANPTTDGFNTLFNTVYNAFCNTSSEPLTITLPYINETFTIQPNIVSNGMQKAGLGVVVSLINSFYYFSVCLFIYKDIAKIIDNLKSGNITADCGNVKTEVL